MRRSLLSDLINLKFHSVLNILVVYLAVSVVIYRIYALEIILICIVNEPRGIATDDNGWCSLQFVYLYWLLNFILF